VWSMETRRLEYSPLLGHDSSVFGVVVDDTSDLLVSCGGNGSIIAWELSTGTRKGSIMQAHTQSVLSIKLNAQYLVSTSKDCTAKIWSRSALENPGERRLSEPFPHNVLRSHPAPINDVVLTDSEVITACGDRHIRVFNIDSGACLRKMSSHEKPIVSLALSADGQYIISAGGDADVVIHHKDSGHAVERLRGHEDLIRAVLVIPDQNLIVSGSYDETVAIWAFNEDGIWKKERSLDTKETQRTLGLDVKERQRTLDFTENIRKAVETGAQTAALSSGRVFCMLYRDKKLLCGAGCTIVGWDFSDDAIIDVDVQRLRTASSESRKKGKGKGRQLLQHIKDRF
jgi:WD40 repeat protein